jgi:hypothetical protein
MSTISGRFIPGVMTVSGYFFVAATSRSACPIFSPDSQVPRARPMMTSVFKRSTW